MQRICKCPVCSEVYDIKTRFPKILVPCGHGVCEQCIGSLKKSSRQSKMCPTCRIQCNIPRNRNKLSTNYQILGLLDSLCAECLERKYSQKCGHCPMKLCDYCREKHHILALPDIADDAKELKELMEHLQDIINKETDINIIKLRGEYIVEKMQESHRAFLQDLQQEHEKNIAQVRAEILQHTDLLLEWREQLMKLLLDCKLFLDKQRTRTQTLDTHVDSVINTKEEFQQKIKALRQIEEHRPDPQYMAVGFKDINIETVLASYRTHVTLPHELTDDNKHNGTINRPVYNKTLYKAKFDDLLHPWDVCTDPVSGNIIVTDVNQHKVFVLSDTLQLVHSFGSEGQGPGEFDNPCGVAVYDGNIFICDSNNSRICVTDTQGAYLYTFGSEGTGSEQYNGLLGISVDSMGLLYVCDSDNHRIKVTDKRGTYVHEFGQDVFGDDCPWYIAVSTDDKVAVTTLAEDIYLFDTDGKHRYTIEKNTLGHCFKATAVCFDGHGNLLVSDNINKRVVVMSDQGEVKGFIGSPGTGPGQFWTLEGVAITESGGIVVCDSQNGSVQLFHVPKTT